MKQYKITKIIFAKDIQDAAKKESKAEVVEIFLNEDIERPDNSLGFKGK